MRWEDARSLLEGIKKTGYVPTENEGYFIIKAQRHVDQKRDMNKSDELPLHSIYREANRGRKS